MTDTLVPITEGAALRDALLQAVGFDRLAPAQRELALAIANRYELDPMLKHLVMVEGRPYITRDGLLHVAHKSNDFDGIEVTDPVLDPEPDAKGRRYWRCRATVYRKSFSRPFVYPGRYPMDGKNLAYAEEMAIKVAEVMTLRRAFDVSAPVMEERWSDDYEDTEPPAEPSSLAERVAVRVAEIVEPADALPEPEEPTETPDEPTDVETVAPEPEPAPEPSTETIDDILPGQPMFVAPPDGFGVDAPVSIESFSRWAAGHDMALVRATAKSLYPDRGKFGDLTPKELDAVQMAVLRAESAEPAPEPEGSPETPDEPEGDGTLPTPTPEPTPVVLCGAESPLSGATCTLDAGHKTSVHRAGLKEAW